MALADVGVEDQVEIVVVQDYQEIRVFLGLLDNRDSQVQS